MMVAESKRVEIIAEAEVNHNGDPQLAKEMVDVAAGLGANTIKFQCFVAESFISPGSSYLPIFKANQLGLDDFKGIKAHADSIGIPMISTAADLDGLQMIVDLGLPVVKLGSTNINNVPLLEGVAESGLEVYLSTGAATLGEIEKALDIVTRITSKPVTLFHCTVQYPAEARYANLRAIPTMKAVFPECRIGYSDHTKGTTAAVAAVALGAEVLEKHFTLDNAMEGPDHAFSTNPADMETYVKALREAETMLGSAHKGPTEVEAGPRLGGRRYVTAICTIPAGTVIEPRMIRSRRVDVSKVAPELLLEPMFEAKVHGWVATRDLVDGDAVTFANVAPAGAR